MQIALKILPWLMFSGMFLASLITGLEHKEDVNLSRDFFYCSVSPPVGYASEIICGLFMVASVIMQIHIGYTLIYGWRTRTLRRDLLPIEIIVRLGVFSIYAAIAVIVTIVLIQYPDVCSPRYPFILMSTFPLVVWIVFWTQKDVLEIWSCRRRRAPDERLSECDPEQTLSIGTEESAKAFRVDEYT
ncbi:hypothetical protein AURDEDRAFT_114328 [Auricularia subglabra TFB-10046 SS5]|nr:hypothetical protein AURDEDRAFT_114328 [Auricularia subglabra TFB-10046 SS5]